MKITVTAQDIKLGKPKRAALCPIARAVRRHVSQHNVLVDGGSIYINGRAYRIPQRVGTFIEKFDRGDAVLPIAFNLPIGADT